MAMTCRSFPHVVRFDLRILQDLGLALEDVGELLHALVASRELARAADVPNEVVGNVFRQPVQVTGSECLEALFHQRNVGMLLL
jgi:hypothetical protein